MAAQIYLWLDLCIIGINENRFGIVMATNGMFSTKQIFELKVQNYDGVSDSVTTLVLVEFRPMKPY